jgi:hypothetical protein
MYWVTLRMKKPFLTLSSILKLRNRINHEHPQTIMGMFSQLFFTLEGLPYDIIHDKCKKVMEVQHSKHLFRVLLVGHLICELMVCHSFILMMTY